MFDRKPAICRICKEGCGLLVTRTAAGMKITGNPVHPVSRGFACFRATRFGAVQDSAERLNSPLLQGKSGWQPISYPDAIALLAEKIGTAQKACGPESIVMYKGESLKHQESTAYLRHLCHGLGSPNYLSVGSICHSSLALGHGLTYGGIPAPDYERVRSILIWGCNPASAFQRTFTLLKEAKGRGVKIIVIDPVATATAKLADVHLPVRPGADGFLALALLKHCAEHGKCGPGNDTSVGWPLLKEDLAAVSLTELVRRTDIDIGQFRQVADMLVHYGPSWIETGLGLELQPRGVQTIRAVACLQAVLDPLARPAKPWGRLKPLPKNGQQPALAPPIGGEEFPVFVSRTGEGQAMRLPAAILDGGPHPVRTMLVAGANPMLTFPDPVLFGRALARLDFLAVFDLFMTETAKKADLVLPAATFLESHELHDYVAVGRPYLGLVRPVEDTGRGWPLWKLVFEMARAMGRDELFPWRDNREALNDRMTGSGIDYSALEASPSLTVQYPVPPVAPGVWRSADGKLHIYSAALAAAGQPGIPAMACFLPESKTEGFDLHLSTGDRVPVYQHSQFHNIPVYREKAPAPHLAVHPDAARQLSIAAGETVTVTTPFGSLEIAVCLSAELRRDCLQLSHGWSEANANLLGGFDTLDPISGFPWLKALPARITKKGGV